MIQIYNIKIHNNTNNNSLNFSPLEKLVITDIDGLTDGTVSFSSSQGFGQVGETMTGSSVEARIITIDGAFLGLSTDLRKNLIDTIVPDMELKIVFNNKLFVIGYAKNWPDVTRERYGATFQFSIYVPYPYWRELDQVSTMLVGIEAKFKFPFNIGNPSVPDTHILGARTSDAYKDIRNDYNVPIPFKIVFYAKTAVENPQIQNIETLEYIRMNRTMVAGETVIIDMLGQTPEITSDALTDGNAFGYFDLDSTFFKLRVGRNLIKFSAGDNENGLWCNIVYYPTVSGAYGDDVTYF